MTKIVGVILVSPSYHGYSADLEPLIDLPSKKFTCFGWWSLALISYLWKPWPTKICFNIKGGLVVHSLHKSLNGLTQTAALWYKGNIVNEHNLIKSINLLQTTSPSSYYFLLVKNLLQTGLIKKFINISKNFRGKKYLQKLIKNIPLIKPKIPKNSVNV